MLLCGLSTPAYAVHTKEKTYKLTQKKTESIELRSSIKINSRETTKPTHTPNENESAHLITLELDLDSIP